MTNKGYLDSRNRRTNGSAPRKKTVLVVCSGNLCRSPMAEGVLRDRVKSMDDCDLTVRSAGTLGIVGEPATREAQAALAEIDIDISGHRSRALSRALIDEADQILVMERRHLETIGRRFPDAAGKTALLGAFGDAEKNDPEIDDPIGGPLSEYRKTLARIRAAVEAFLQRSIRR